MRLGITQKLFFAIFLAAALAIFSSTFIIQLNLTRGVTRLVGGMEKEGMSRLARALESDYQRMRGWDASILTPTNLNKIINASFPELRPPPSDEVFRFLRRGPEGLGKLRPRPVLPPHIAHQFIERIFLLDANRVSLMGLYGLNTDSVPDSEIIPLRYQDKIIGYLGIQSQGTLDSVRQRGFLYEQRYTFFLISVLVLFLSAGIALLLAVRMVKPLKKIAEAIHELATGGYSVRVPVQSSDELGRLASDFNALALVMEQNEGARRRWVADISHELRTPLTFLRSQVEAMQDGIRQGNTESFRAIHNEIMCLSRLVDDLYQLSMSDVGAQTYQKIDLDLYELLKHAVSMMSSEFHSKKIAIKINKKEGPSTVFGDPVRLLQLFRNLLQNTAKYTESEGELLIQFSNDSDKLTIDFQDSPPGVAEEELDQLFERFYRVESSRNRATGGAGLGLAICRNIVHAHEGAITARPSPLGGVWIRIEMPGYGVLR